MSFGCLELFGDERQVSQPRKHHERPNQRFVFDERVRPQNDVFDSTIAVTDLLSGQNGPQGVDHRDAEVLVDAGWLLSLSVWGQNPVNLRVLRSLAPYLVFVWSGGLLSSEVLLNVSVSLPTSSRITPSMQLLPNPWEEAGFTIQKFETDPGEFTLSLRFLKANRRCSLQSFPWAKTMPPPSEWGDPDSKNADMIVLKLFGRPVNLSSLNEL